MFKDESRKEKLVGLRDELFKLMTDPPEYDANGIREFNEHTWPHIYQLLMTIKNSLEKEDETD